MENWIVFALGSGGALIAYVLVERERRITEAFGSKKFAVRMFIFDLVAYMVCGGLVAAFLIQPSGHAGAILTGVGWETTARRALSKPIPEAHSRQDSEGWDEPV